MKSRIPNLEFPNLKFPKRIPNLEFPKIKNPFFQGILDFF